MTRKANTISSLILPIICLGTSAGFPATMSETSQSAKRSPGSPRYEDICFSPRTTSAGGRDVVEVAKAFHATRIEWLTPYFREGGNVGRLEFENIDLRPVAPRAYDYVPPFLFWIAGKMEQVTLKNISSHAPIDDRPLVWIQPDAKIDRLVIDGMNVHDPRKQPGRAPLIRTDGRIALLQVRDVVVQRPQAQAPVGSLIATSPDRFALKTFMEARAGIVKPQRHAWLA